jgi:hypothetical protein
LLISLISLISLVSAANWCVLLVFCSLFVGFIGYFWFQGFNHGGNHGVSSHCHVNRGKGASQSVKKGQSNRSGKACNNSSNNNSSGKNEQTDQNVQKDPETAQSKQDDGFFCFFFFCNTMMAWKRDYFESRKAKMPMAPLDGSLDSRNQAMSLGVSLVDTTRLGVKVIEHVGTLTEAGQRPRNSSRVSAASAAASSDSLGSVASLSSGAWIHDIRSEELTCVGW